MNTSYHTWSHACCFPVLPPGYLLLPLFFAWLCATQHRLHGARSLSSKSLPDPGEETPPSATAFLLGHGVAKLTEAMAPG